MRALLLLLLCSCGASHVAKPAAYGVELEECNRTSKTCDESIACENLARAKYGRPLRDADEGCK